MKILKLAIDVYVVKNYYSDYLAIYLILNVIYNVFNLELINHLL